MEVKKVIEIRIDQETLYEIISDRALEMGYKLKGELKYDDTGTITIMADEYQPEAPAPVKEVVDFGKAKQVKKSEEQPVIEKETVQAPPVAQEVPKKLPSTPEELEKAMGEVQRPVAVVNRLNTAQVAAPANAPWTGLPGYQAGLGNGAPSQEQQKAVNDMMAQFEAAKAEFQKAKGLAH